MAIDSTTSLVPGIYTNAFRTLLPGLLIGVMFMAVAFATKSAADSERQSIETSLTARTATPEDLREKISLHAGVMAASPLKANLITATESGLRKLSDPQEAAALERVTIEIDLPTLNQTDPASSTFPLELLEVLSRRASPLQLQLTLRVAPANTEIAMQWFDEVRKNAEPGHIADKSEIAVSLDKSLPIGKLKLDVLRTKKMVLTKESQR